MSSYEDLDTQFSQEISEDGIPTTGRLREACTYTRVSPTETTNLQTAFWVTLGLSPSTWGQPNLMVQLMLT